jgi:hypothetical protein
MGMIFPPIAATVQDKRYFASAELPTDLDAPIARHDRKVAEATHLQYRYDMRWNRCFGGVMIVAGMVLSGMVLSIGTAPVAWPKGLYWLAFSVLGSGLGLWLSTGLLAVYLDVDLSAGR